MCGFAGFLSLRADRSEADLQATAGAGAARIVHRGPDDAGTWADAEAGIALAHRRLSIIDVSPEGHQPMASACGRFVIAYNGEIYNFPDLRRALEDDGASFRGHSDTEVLLAAVVNWGIEEAIGRCNGMFAFALWDRRERVLTLGRDRLGQKPLYYGWGAEGLVFASELKAILALPGVSADIDAEALALYMQHLWVPAPYSIHRGIHKLPPGCLLHLGPGAARRPDGFSPDPDVPGAPGPRAYWSAVAAAEAGLTTPFDGSPAEAEQALHDLLRDAVGKCMVSDVPLGAFLSGGIDSTTVVALMQDQASRPVRTFSIGFNEVQFNEAEAAADVARHLGTDHTEFYVSHREALDLIPSLPDIYDEPFADSSQVPTHLVCRLARRHVTVALSGDGGDELFGGYNRYFWGLRLRSLFGGGSGPLRRLAAAGLRSVPITAWDSAATLAGRAVPRLAGFTQAGDKMHKLAGVLGASDADEFYRRLLSMWAPHERPVRGADAPGSYLINDPARWPLAGGGFAHRMMLLDTLSYLPDDILVKVDRAAMAVSLETRVPLLDHRVYEFAWRLPQSWKVEPGRGKKPLRAVLDRHVPRSLVDRPKMGFGVPIGQWLRGELRPWAEDLLGPGARHVDDMLDGALVARMWDEHLKGRRNWQYRLWSVLMFQAWRRRQAEQGAAPIQTAAGQ